MKISNDTVISHIEDRSICIFVDYMNRGLEITAEAADSPQSVVTEQVTNGVSVRMAALYLLLAHGEEISA